MDLCSCAQPGSQRMTCLHAQAKQQVGHCLFMATCCPPPRPRHFLVAIGSVPEVSAISGTVRGSKGTLCAR